jgi:hypothetical protein
MAGKQRSRANGDRAAAICSPRQPSDRRETHPFQFNNNLRLRLKAVPRCGIGSGASGCRARGGADRRARPQGRGSSPMISRPSSKPPHRGHVFGRFLRWANRISILRYEELVADPARLLRMAGIAEIGSPPAAAVIKRTPPTPAGDDERIGLAERIRQLAVRRRTSRDLRVLPRLGTGALSAC